MNVAGHLNINETKSSATRKIFSLKIFVERQRERGEKERGRIGSERERVMFAFHLREEKFHYSTCSQSDSESIVILHIQTKPFLTTAALLRRRFEWREFDEVISMLVSVC